MLQTDMFLQVALDEELAGTKKRETNRMTEIQREGERERDRQKQLQT
jgi:hypothetical protein